MAFKVAFLVRAPEANPETDISTLKSKLIEVTSVAVELGNTAQTIQVCKDLVKNDGIQAIVLCPAVSYKLASDISDAVGDRIAVFVARGDFNSINIAQQTIEEEWFAGQQN